MALGPVMVDIEGTALAAADRELLRDPRVGGVILFTRNYADPEQLAALTAEIHALRDPRLLIAVDHEGGRVQRFRDGFTRLPACGAIGARFDAEPRAAERLAETAGWVMAAELRAVGVDFSFAPVLDLDHGRSAVIGDRAFHRDPEAVAALARACMRGMHRAGMPAVGKHFPGHGHVEADSHLALPSDPRTLADIRLDDLVPFERLIHAGLEGIMPAHVVYPAEDEQPAGFSRHWLQGVLRGRLGFEGAIFSDDLSMEGAVGAGSYGERAHLALAAGCDMVLVCNNRAGAAATVESLEGHSDPATQVRLIRLHGRPGPGRTELQASREWRESVGRLERLEAAEQLDLDW